MNYLVVFALAFLKVVTGLKSRTVELAANKTKDTIKIATGSCFQFGHHTNSIFKDVQAWDPDVWIWNGDAAYADQVSLKFCMPSLLHLRSRGRHLWIS